MEATLNFALKSGIGLLMLYLFYYTLLRNQTSFRFNRAYLLLAPLVALTLPLVTWPALLAPAPAVAKALQAIQLNEVVVVAYRPSGSILADYLTPARMALAIYGLVAAVLLLRLFRQLWHIRRLKSDAIPVEQAAGRVHILRLKQPHASFAFLNHIYLSNQEQLSPRERRQVLAHELAHVQLGHTYDVLYYELLSVVLWFNPLVWLLKQELRNVHEFQADARVLEQHQPQEYRALLSKEVLFNMGVPVGSYFQKPQVLRRLYMLQRGKQAGWLRPLLTLPLLLVLLLSLSSQQVTADIASQLTSTAQAAQSNEATSESLNPGEDMIELPETQAKADAKMPIMRGDTTEDTPVQEDKPTDNIHNLHYIKPYTYVEQMPQFKGGEAEMMKFLGMNVRYPKEAQEAGVEGIVVASFVVEKDGTLSDIQIIKDLGMGTSEEVIRVIEKMSGQWLPGRQNGDAVPVRYTLPVRFTIK
ncbi:TonB family protein [Pontibacter russatus]|uniref:TonB family protein n=1 Tax=Pontibacter russatus TaxID=2694929 RepID=UPI0013796553|nr:M56 family metallopeptidase [Pontibacter russatus]